MSRVDHGWAGLGAAWGRASRLRRVSKVFGGKWEEYWEVLRETEPPSDFQFDPKREVLSLVSWLHH